MSLWVLGEFQSAKALIRSVTELRAKGYRRMDTYTPYPVKGLDEALGLPPTRIPLVGLLCGLTAAVGAYLLQWFTMAVDYPINVGDRPLHSAPTFIPITFESAVLGASVGMFLGLLALWRFPRLHHPVFELEAFRSASHKGYWVSVTLDSGSDEAESLLAGLRGLGARHVGVVPVEEAR